ncbi:MAG: MATE family efflux transporter [Gammaproteobacteria bacterium]|nr:MAG: MATE family efflux transporter [Gammaproteobacteria bacterium]
MWRIAAPMILSNISIPLVGITDTVITGHLENPEYLASIAVATTIIGFFVASMNFLRMGTTGITAQYFGAKNFDGFRIILGQTLLVAISISFIVILLQNQINQIGLFLIGSQESVAYYASQYFYIRIWGIPATLINFSLIGWFIGLQNASAPLKMVIVTNITNIILSLVFVLIFQMQIKGIALASVIAEILGTLIGFIYVLKELKRYKGQWISNKILKLKEYKRFMQININLFIRTLSLIFAFAFLTAQGARYGGIVLGANALLMNFQNLLAYVLDGFAHAAEALVGKAVGKKDSKLFKSTVNICLRWSVYIALIFTLFYILLGENLIYLITHHQNIRDMAIEYLPWMIVSPIVSVWSFLYDGVFTGATRSRDMRNAMLVSLLMIFLPSWYLLQPLGNHGLWLAFTLFMFSRGVTMHLLYRRINLSSD